MTSQQRSLRRIAGPLITVLLLTGCAAERPLELACMDRFDIERFEMGCWAGRFGDPELFRADRYKHVFLLQALDELIPPLRSLGVPPAWDAEETCAYQRRLLRWTKSIRSEKITATLLVAAHMILVL